MTNRGSADHNFVVADLDVASGTLKPDEVATATFEMPDSRVEFVCSFHAGMKGELVPED